MVLHSVLTSSKLTMGDQTVVHTSAADRSISQLFLAQNSEHAKRLNSEYDRVPVCTVITTVCPFIVNERRAAHSFQPTSSVPTKLEGEGGL